MRHFKLTLRVLALLLPGIVSGCVVVAAGAGAGTVAYAKGALEVTEAVEYGKAWSAALRGAREAGLALVSRSEHAGHGLIVARTGEDQSVTIKVDRLYPRKTAIEIRVGTFGNRPLSMRIYQHIKANL